MGAKKRNFKKTLKFVQQGAGSFAQVDTPVLRLSGGGLYDTHWMTKDLNKTLQLQGIDDQQHWGLGWWLHNRTEVQVALSQMMQTEG